LGEGKYKRDQNFLKKYWRRYLDSNMQPTPVREAVANLDFSDRGIYSLISFLIYIQKINNNKKNYIIIFSSLG